MFQELEKDKKAKTAPATGGEKATKTVIITAVAKKGGGPEKVKGERMENDADHMEVSYEC